MMIGDCLLPLQPQRKSKIKTIAGAVIRISRTQLLSLKNNRAEEDKGTKDAPISTTRKAKKIRGGQMTEVDNLRTGKSLATRAVKKEVLNKASPRDKLSLRNKKRKKRQNRILMIVGCVTKLLTPKRKMTINQVVAKQEAKEEKVEEKDVDKVVGKAAVKGGADKVEEKIAEKVEEKDEVKDEERDEEKDVDKAVDKAAVKEDADKVEVKDEEKIAVDSTEAKGTEEVLDVEKTEAEVDFEEVTAEDLAAEGAVAVDLAVAVLIETVKMAIAENTGDLTIIEKVVKMGEVKTAKKVEVVIEEEEEEEASEEDSIEMAMTEEEDLEEREGKVDTNEISEIETMIGTTIGMETASVDKKKEGLVVEGKETKDAHASVEV